MLALVSVVFFLLALRAVDGTGSILRQGERRKQRRAATAAAAREEQGPHLLPECQHNSDEAMANYREGRATMFFFHITHNAGTQVKTVALKNGKDLMMASGKITEEGPLPRSNLSSHIPCNSNDFVSVISMRDPVSRIFAGDGMWRTTSTENLDSCNTDNYGLRKLVGKDFGTALTQDDVAFAKQRLEYFDVVLDVGNFANSMGLMCTRLGWENCDITGTTESKKYNKYKTNEGRLRPEEKLLDPEVFRMLKERNRFEIEVYQHAVKLSQKQLQSSISSTAPVRSASKLQVRETTENELTMLDLMDSESQLKWLCPKDSIA